MWLKYYKEYLMLKGYACCKELHDKITIIISFTLHCGMTIK